MTDADPRDIDDSEADRAAVMEFLWSFTGRLDKVKLERYAPCDRYANGFVLGVAAEWFLLWVFHDFRPDGFQLLRVEDVYAVRHNKYERFWTRVVIDEGIANELPDPGLVVGDLPTMLRTLFDREEMVTIECEYDTDADRQFFIGRLIDVRDNWCRFAHFDADGEWDDEECVIDLADVTSVQFGTPYEDIFSRHLSGPCPFL